MNAHRDLKKYFVISRKINLNLMLRTGLGIGNAEPV
jgi:hypothetical protein